MRGEYLLDLFDDLGFLADGLLLVGVGHPQGFDHAEVVAVDGFQLADGPLQFTDLFQLGFHDVLVAQVLRREPFNFAEQLHLVSLERSVLK